MKTYPSFLAAVGLLLTLSLGATRAETLAELLEESGMGAIIGTWVDEESGGDNISLTYSWHVKNHALGLTVKAGENETGGLIGVDPASGEVKHVAFNNKGGFSMGKWSNKNGVATLEVKSTDAEGGTKNLIVTHVIREGNLIVGMKDADTDEGGEFTLVRKAEK